ncbi:MAG: cell division protein FtsA [Desulfobulbaceae bacterium]|nr:cell division protein FtsA [Desulfobulbaceae bacterium]
MLNRHTSVSAVNIGASTSTAVIADVDSHGEMVLVGYGQCPTVGLSNDLITDIRGLGGAIAECLNQAEEMAEVRAGALIMAVGGEYVQILRSRGGMALHPGGGARNLRAIDRDDMKTALENASAVPISPELQILHVLPVNYLVDGRKVRNPEELSGTRLDVEVMVVAAKHSVLRSLVKAAEYGGYRVGQFCYRPLATSRAVLSEDEMDQGSCLIDMGSRHTDVALFRENRLVFSSTLALGGGHITDDTGHMLAVSGSEAEKLKLKYGYCGPLTGEDVRFQVTGAGEGGSLWKMVKKSTIGGGVIQPRVEEIFREAKTTINEFVARENWPGGAVLTGGTSQLPGIREVAADVFPFPVINGGNVGFENLNEVTSRPDFSTVLGLVAFDCAQKQNRREDVSSNRLSRWCGKVIRQIHTVI